MIISTEYNMEMHYKLIMIRVHIDGPAQMMVYNESVMTSCFIHSSTIKKNHNYIAYHQVREDISTTVIRLSHIPVKYNPAGILTKPLGTQHQYPLMKELLVQIFFILEKGVR